MEPSLDALTEAPHGDINRLELSHIPTRTFRWVGIIEWLVIVAFFGWALIPLYIVLFILSRGSFSIGTLLRMPDLDRLHATWHDIHGRSLDANGTVHVEGRQRFIDPVAGEARVREILAAAHRHGVQVVNGVEDEPDSLHTYYGGRPLMARPDLPDAEALWERLLRARCKRDATATTTEIHFHEEATDRVTLTLRLIGLLILYPVLSEDNRRALQNTRAELQARHPPTWSFTVSASKLLLVQRYGEREHVRHDIDSHALLTIVWTPSLSFGARAQLLPPALHLNHEAGSIRMTIPVHIGRHLADYLTAETLRRHPNPLLEKS